ncbi:MAG: 5'-nucleotidase C-terminal domain-containing protein, partial [Oscillospiraceae bacterium]|nr:5'-nucleotidase C-terminal domain-containing protein [Oscillospiraceae bacterium]
MLQKTRRLFAALFAVVLTLSLCPWALADYPVETRPGAEGDYAGKTVILHSNDVHGEIMGYAYIAALRTEYESKGANVILADAGDFSQGDVAVSHSKGADAVAMMNAAGYDVATLGNHEFDYGYEQLKQNLEAAKFAVICADIFEGGALVWNPSWTYEKGGLKIGFFGLDTPDTRTQANPAMTRGLTFLDQEEIYERAKEQVSALRGDGADIVIALTHLGVNEGSESNSVDLFRHTEGIDLIIDGHSHTVMTAGENGEPVQSTGTKFAYIGVVVIDNEKKAIEDRYLIPTKVTQTVTKDGKETEEIVSELAKDEAVAAKAREIIDRVDAEYNVKFAESEIFLVGDDDARSVRSQETNLGDLITDAIVWKVLKENADVLSADDGNGGTLSVDHNHVVGITNGGGIRVSLNAGDLTRKDLNTVLPFGNTVAVVFVSGAELLEALEASTYSAPEPLGGYPQTFGIEFTLDTAKPYDRGENYSSSYYKPKTIQRVSITKINGEPFDPSAIYAVVTNNFLAAGGDTYYSFKDARAQFDTGIPMDEAVMEYVDVNLNNVVSVEPYGEPRGDQTILPRYAVAVADGSGAGEYAKGAYVTITANAPESGKRFKEWTGAFREWKEGASLIFAQGNATTETAVFAMPSKDVSVTATYEDIPSHNV